MSTFIQPSILTHDGAYFDLIHPERSALSIDAIAHALSQLCRFTGHVERFYSVAQHSVMVSRLVPPEHALEGLLHDAAEAVLGDVASPLKHLLPMYQAIEHQVEQAIWSRYGFSALAPEVKWADLVMLATERRDLMPRAVRDGSEWAELAGIEPLAEHLVPLASYTARELFIARFAELDGRAPVGREARAAAAPALLSQ